MKIVEYAVLNQFVGIYRLLTDSRICVIVQDN